MESRTREELLEAKKLIEDPLIEEDFRKTMREVFLTAIERGIITSEALWEILNQNPADA